jgi:multiple sugar transport system substrate-binding protein
MPKSSILRSAVAGVAAVLSMAAVTPAAAQEKIVRIWHTETEAKAQKVKSAIARRFEAQHPGVRLEIEGLGWAELEGRITAALTAGTPPELSHGQPITCTALQAKGLLLPLDEVVKAVGEANINRQVRRVCHVDGHQFGLVHAFAASLLLYRKDMADKIGLKQPESWAELVKAVAAMTQDTDGDGQIDVYGVTLPGDNLFINIILGEMIKANDGALFDKDNRPLMTSPKMIETLAQFRALVKYAHPGWEGGNYLQSYQNFYNGKAAIMLFGLGRGAGMIERFQPPELANDHTFATWVKPHGPSGSAPAVQVDGEPWMLFKQSAHPAEAKEFLKFFYRDENYLEYVSASPIHLLPITNSLRNSEKYQSIEMLKRWKSWIDMQQSYLDKDQVKPALVTDWSDLTEKTYLLDVLNSGILRDMVMDVVIERMEPAEAAEKAQKRLESLLRSKGVLAGGDGRKQSALKPDTHAN